MTISLFEKENVPVYVHKETNIIFHYNKLADVLYISRIDISQPFYNIEPDSEFEYADQCGYFIFFGFEKTISSITIIHAKEIAENWFDNKTGNEELVVGNYISIIPKDFLEAYKEWFLNVDSLDWD